MCLREQYVCVLLQLTRAGLLSRLRIRNHNDAGKTVMFQPVLHFFVQQGCSVQVSQLTQ